jgi:hypothetical protein
MSHFLILYVSEIGVPLYLTILLLTNPVSLMSEIRMTLSPEDAFSEELSNAYPPIISDRNPNLHHSHPSGISNGISSSIHFISPVTMNFS